MSAEEHEKDWKLKLRYGRTRTPFHHFTAIAEGTVTELAEGFECPPGSAFMGMKTWASSAEESADMMRVIAREIGFTVTGDVQIFESEAQQPPRDNPFGYDIKFTPFNADA